MGEVKTELKIKKASLKKEGLELEYDQILESEEDGPVVNAIKLTGGHKPHPDLVKAFNPLVLHLALICDQVTEASADAVIHSIGKGGKKKDVTLLLSSLRQSSITQACEVTGFSIGGSDEHEGVVLIGNRKLSSVSVLNLTSPFQKFESEYKHKEDLEIQLNILIQECIEYINGKHAPNPQLELELDTNKKEEAA